MTWSSAAVPARPDFAVRRRLCRLQVGISRPFVRGYRAVLGGLGAGIAAAAVGTAVSHSPIVGAATGLALAALIALAGAWFLADPARRAALELINDHAAIERAEWKA